MDELETWITDDPREHTFCEVFLKKKTEYYGVTAILICMDCNKQIAVFRPPPPPEPNRCLECGALLPEEED